MINYSSLKRRALSAFTLVLIAYSMCAQNFQTEVEILQEAVGMEKKVAIANFIELQDEAKAFWKIYDEYELDRRELGKQRINIIVDYAKSFQDITDEEIESLYKRRKALKKSFDKLQNTYFNRMKKEVGVSKAAQFWQVESYFDAIIQANIYSQIPFIGENIKTN